MTLSDPSSKIDQFHIMQVLVVAIDTTQEEQSKSLQMKTRITTSSKEQTFVVNEKKDNHDDTVKDTIINDKYNMDDDTSTASSMIRWYLFSRGGRSGTCGEKLMRGPYLNEIECQEEFEKEFMMKTGIGWDEAIVGTRPKSNLGYSIFVWSHLGLVVHCTRNH